jgi:endogenous inhibitor of DNA gyrase (YacG/DUF329 family)
MTEKLVMFPERRARRRKCPVCGRPPLTGSEPFCSKRCADEDLRRWLTGGYRIPTNEPPDPETNDPESGRN